MVISGGVSCLFGFFVIKTEELVFNIPILKLIRIAGCDVLIHICCITALLRTNYTTLVVVNTCSIISVILVGAFCSGVNYSNQVEGAIEGNAEEGDNANERQAGQRGP